MQLKLRHVAPLQICFFMVPFYAKVKFSVFGRKPWTIKGHFLTCKETHFSFFSFLFLRVQMQMATPTTATRNTMTMVPKATGTAIIRICVWTSFNSSSVRSPLGVASGGDGGGVVGV